MWGYRPDGGMMGYGGDWGWMMLFGGIFWLLVIVLGIAAVAWFARSSLHGLHPPARDHGSSALDILEERYARGEIDRDEYLQKKRDILGRGAP